MKLFVKTLSQLDKCGLGLIRITRKEYPKKQQKSKDQIVLLRTQFYKKVSFPENSALFKTKLSFAKNSALFKKKLSFAGIQFLWHFS